MYLFTLIANGIYRNLTLKVNNGLFEFLIYFLWKTIPLPIFVFTSSSKNNKILLLKQENKLQANIKYLKKVIKIEQLNLQFY